MVKSTLRKQINMWFAWLLLSCALICSFNLIHFLLNFDPYREVAIYFAKRIRENNNNNNKNKHFTLKKTLTQFMVWKRNKHSIMRHIFKLVAALNSERRKYKLGQRNGKTKNTLHSENLQITINKKQKCLNCAYTFHRTVLSVKGNFK